MTLYQPKKFCVIDDEGSGNKPFSEQSDLWLVLYQSPPGALVCLMDQRKLLLLWPTVQQLKLPFRIRKLR